MLLEISQWSKPKELNHIQLRNPENVSDRRIDETSIPDYIPRPAIPPPRFLQNLNRMRESQRLKQLTKV